MNVEAREIVVRKKKKKKKNTKKSGAILFPERERTNSRGSAGFSRAAPAYLFAKIGYRLRSEIPLGFDA